MAFPELELTFIAKVEKMNGKSSAKLISILLTTCMLALSAANNAYSETSLDSRTEKDITNPGKAPCLSDDEARLLREVNEYRQLNGLAPVAVSYSMTKVAQIHAWDLQSNYSEDAVDSRGEKCSLHSWSSKGNWSPVCYTQDSFYADRMWIKPREIMNYIYTGNGYENAYWTSGNRINPARVLEMWSKSPGHNALLLEQGVWAGRNWPAAGIGIKNNVAVIWFGDAPDPLGTIQMCNSRAEQL